MKSSRTLLILLLAAFTVFPVLAQSTDRRTTVEELYLENVEVQIVLEQAQAAERETKLIALNTLKNMIDSGKVGTGDPDAHLVLDYLANEGTGRVVYEGGRLLNYYPVVRREAANLLGQLGGENSRLSLVEMLRTDDEPMVLSEAAYALGQIGYNENNEVSTALADAVFQQDPLVPDNNFAFTVLLVYEKLAQKNNGLSDPNAFRAIIQIAQGNYIKVVKQKAVEVLNSLRKF